MRVWIGSKKFYRIFQHCMNWLISLDKYLSYRRETALQGELFLAKSERLEWGDNSLRNLYRSVFNYCEVIGQQSYRIR